MQRRRFICAYMKCTLLLFSLLLFQKIFSQDFSILSYDERNGLNRNYINDIRRDINGYYWLATEKGIVRFDGNNFTYFPSTERNNSNAVVKKLHLYKNNLYLIYEKKGCLKFNIDNHITNIITEDNTDDLIQENDSIIFVLNRINLKKINTRSNDISKITLGENFTISQKKGTLTKWGNDLSILLPRQFWILLDKSTLKIKIKRSIESIDIKNAFGIHSQKYVFSGSGAIFTVDKENKIAQASLNSKNKNNNYTEWKPISANAGFYILNNSRIYSYINNISTPIPLVEFKNIELINIFIQDSLNLLIGTNAGLLHLYKKNLGNYSFEDVNGLVNERLRIRRKMLPWGKNKLLLLGHPFNYVYEKNGPTTLLSKNTASSYDAVKVGSYLYIATEDHGIQQFNINSGVSENFTKNFLERNRKHYCILFNPKDSILISAYNDTLLRYDFKTRKFQNIKSPIKGELIKAIRWDTSTGNYWIAAEGGLFEMDAEFNLVPGSTILAENLHGSIINDLILDANKRDVWVAHENGIVKIKKSTRKVIDSVPPGCFRNPKVVSLLQDNKGRIWMGTYAGIVAYDPLTNGLIKLTKLNGIINSEFNYNSACKINENEFVFGGLTGYDVINPMKFPINKTMPLGLVTGYELIKGNTSEFHAYNKEIPSVIRFNTENETVKILLGSKHTLTSFNYSYHYRFNNEAWSSLTNLPFISISKLQPGNYTIEVKAFDEFGIPVTFNPIVVKAIVPLYKSKIFLLTLAIITFLSMSTIIFLILRNQKRENEIKENISMDLHDEIGTLLARALLVSQTIHFPDRENHLNKYLQEALYSLRVYINTMNTEKLLASQLAVEIKEMLHQSFSPLNYTFNFRENGLEGIKISSSKFRCIKLCFYEIINNMIRHSKGNFMNVSINVENSNLHLIFKDNGRLTNLWDFTSKGKGIKNIKKRIQKQKGKLFIEVANEGQGLLTKIIIPY